MDEIHSRGWAWGSALLFLGCLGDVALAQQAGSVREAGSVRVENAAPVSSIVESSSLASAALRSSAPAGAAPRSTALRSTALWNAAPGRVVPQSAGLGFVHPLQVPDAALEQQCQATSKERREHIYLFFINGVDRLYLGNLNSLCAYVRQLGFPHAQCGQMSQSRDYYYEIRRLHRADPQAKFVLLGFSAGAYLARNIAHSLQDEGIGVEVLIYIGGDALRNEDRSRPANARRIINITGHGYLLTGRNLFMNGEHIAGAENLRLPVRHMALPSQAETISAVLRALVDLAGEPQPVTPSPATSSLTPSSFGVPAATPAASAPPVTWRPAPPQVGLSPWLIQRSPPAER